MSTLREIEHYFNYLPAAQLEILLELRNLVNEIAPGAAEELRHNGLVYFWSERGGPVSAGICQIAVVKGCIHLAFTHGSFLPDPSHLLTGKRLYMRYVNIQKFESTPWDAIKTLITAASRFDPYTETFR